VQRGDLAGVDGGGGAALGGGLGVQACLEERRVAVVVADLDDAEEHGDAERDGEQRQDEGLEDLDASGVALGLLGSHYGPFSAPLAMWLPLAQLACVIRKHTR